MPGRSNSALPRRLLGGGRGGCGGDGVAGRHRDAPPAMIRK